MLPELAGDLILKDAPEVEGYRVLGPCGLHSRIGQGGMGAVYRGLHLNLGIEVAVKCLLPGRGSLNAELVTRFEREAHLAARVTHQNLVRVYDIGHEHGLHYLVMEYITGETLRERVSRRGRSSIEEAVTIVRQAASGLAAAHDEGIVHRDVKPENIMVAAARKLVKLADLGLSRLNESDVNLTASTVRMGTPPYMPPEQWQSLASVGRPGDVWALGATLHFLLTGQNAFTGSVYEIERRIREEPFPDILKERPEVPGDLAAVLRRATDRRPENRHGHARELDDALGAVAVQHAMKPTIDDAADFDAKLSPSALRRSTALPPLPASVLEQLRGKTVTVTRVAPAPRKRRGRRVAAGGALLLAAVAVLAIAWSLGQPAARSRDLAGFEFLGANAQGFDEYVHLRSGIVMVRLPGGSFLMGSGAADADAQAGEQPARSVAVGPFLIAKYEVSQAEWARHMTDNPTIDVDRGADRPVSNVTWIECKSFCDTVGLALPSEAQWEYACRAGSNSAFAGGDVLGREAAHFDAGDAGTSMPVKSYSPNGFGLFNMHGNVFEWCHDLHAARPAAGSAGDAGSNSDRVYRGGGYLREVSHCRAAARQHDDPVSFRNPDMGFRPAFSLPGG